MNKYLKVFLFTILVSGVSGTIMYFMKKAEAEESSAAHPVTTIIDPAVQREANAYNKHVIDSAISMLHSGYLVLRTGMGADSYLLSQMNLKDKTYSHCGIVMVEHGYPFVYHSIGGEDNPDERLRRDSASFFFSPLHNSGLAVIQYDYDSARICRLKGVVTDYYLKRPKFDMKFDLATDDKLYCAEFVYKAVNKAMEDSTYLKKTTILGHDYVGVDDLFVNEHAHMIWQVKYK